MTYVFEREDGFYVLEIEDGDRAADDVALGSVPCNPGTMRVTNMDTRKVLFDATHESMTE